MKNNRALYKNIIMIILILFLGYNLFCMFIACGTSYPREYREGADVSFTNTIVRGENPYQLGAENQNAYVYGPLNSALAALIVIATGANVLTVHYILCFIYNILFICIIGREVYRNTTNVIFSLFSANVGLSCVYRLGYISTVPDSLGILMMALVLTNTARIKKEWRWYHYGAISALTVLCFYTKPYFLYVGIPVFLFLLIKNKWGALQYVLFGLIIGFISLAVMNFLYPTFTINTIYLELVENSAARPGEQKDYIYYSFKQMLITFRDYWFLFICLGIYVFHLFREWLGHKKVEKVNDRILLYLICIACSLPTLLYIGQNTGAWISYHRQLLCPSVIIVATIGIANLYNRMMDTGESIYLRMVICVCLILTIIQTRPIVKIYTEEENIKWKQLYETLDYYSLQGDIYLGPQLAVYACERNLPVYNNGHEYFQGMGTGSWQGYAESINKYKRYFPVLPDLYMQVVQQSSVLENKIKNEEFALIATGMTKIESFDRAIAENYDCIEIVNLVSGEYEWAVNLYVPKSGSTTVW